MILHDISWSFMIVYMANIQIVNMIGGSCKHIMFTWNMIPLYRISFWPLQFIYLSYVLRR